MVTLTLRFVTGVDDCDSELLTAGGLQIGPQSDGAFIALLAMKTKAKLIESFKVTSQSSILEFPILIM